MKKIYIILLVMLSLNGYSQNNEDKNPGKFDIRLGVGYTFLGSGDYACISFENEVNYRISNYFTTSASLGLGRSFSGTSGGSATFIEGNLNIFVSPFKNNRVNDLRIGGGISVYNIFDVYLSSIHYLDGMEFKDYTTVKETTFGGTVIIEDTFNVKDKYFIGAKVFMQPYVNGDINSGFMAKFGVRL